MKRIIPLLWPIVFLTFLYLDIKAFEWFDKLKEPSSLSVADSLGAGKCLGLIGLQVVRYLFYGIQVFIFGALKLFNSNFATSITLAGGAILEIFLALLAVGIILGVIFLAIHGSIGSLLMGFVWILHVANSFYSVLIFLFLLYCLIRGWYSLVGYNKF